MTDKPAPRAVTMTIALAALVLVNAILETMPALALPVIQADLRITPAAGGLLIAALTLTAAISTPIVGKLGDAFGPRRILFATTGFVIVGAALSGTGASYPAMIVGEVLQGLGAGLLSLTFTLVRSQLPDRWVKGVVGGVTAMYVLGATINLLVVGPVSTLLSWHWLFGIPALLGAAAAVAAWWLVPSIPRSGVKSAIGWPGALSFAVFLVALIMAIEEIPQMGLATTGSAVMVVLVVGLGVGWFMMERRSRAPFVPLTMIRRRGIWTANAAALVQGIGSVVGTILMPQLITLPRSSGGLGGSITEVGLYLLPSCVAGVIGTPLGGIAGQWLGSRTVIVIGTVLQLAGTVGLTMQHSDLWQVLLMTVLFGFGAGSASAAMYNLAISASGSHETGLSTGLNNLTRGLGIALGSVISTTILTASVAPGTRLPTDAGFVGAFAVSSGVLVLGVVLAFVVPAQPRAAAPQLAQAAA